MAGPLTGRRVAVTRAAEQAGELAERLRALGAEPLVCAALAAAPPADPGPLDAALDGLAGYDWLVVASANAARALLGRLAERGLGPGALGHLRVAAVGPASARPLADAGLRVDLVAAEHTAAGLLAELGDLAGRRVLLPQADIARPGLAEGLRARGALVDAVTAYRTVPGDGVAALLEALRARQVDAVTFASPSALRFVLQGAGQAGLSREQAARLLAQVPLVCIGPTTAAALRAEGLPVAAEARPHTAEGLARALVELFAPA